VKFFATLLLAFAVLTAAMTYPRLAHLRDTVHDDGDPLMVAWALAWVAHQLPIAPAHLLDANIFYPERGALAFSETFLLPAVVAAPLRWAGAGPILVYNLVFLFSVILSGAGTALLVRSLTGNAGAAILSGIVFAFLPYRIDHQSHLQLQQTQFLPLALWAFHRLLERGRMLDGILFGTFVAGQVLSCVYYGLFLVPYLAAVCGALLLADRVQTRSRVLALAAGALVALLAVAPLARAYMGAREVVGERNADVLDTGSATLTSYLAVPGESLLYGGVLHQFARPERVLFPGFMAIALAIVALWPPVSAVRVAYALGLIVAFEASLGVHGFTYRWLFDHVLPYRALRVPARMGVMVGFSLAVLAGYGAARITSALRSSKTQHAVVVILGLLMLAEYASKPLESQTIPLVPPPAYADMMRDRGAGPAATIFEFPASPVDDPTYMYYSTFHWQPLINGYSGFFPASYVAVVDAIKNFPDNRSIDAIKAHGARYLLVHGERLYGGRYEEVVTGLAGRTDVVLISRSPSAREGQHGEISLYRVSTAAATYRTARR
jgi:hypothetical protein